MRFVPGEYNRSMNIVQTLLQKYKDVQLKIKNKKEFISYLNDLAHDGTLTSDEIALLQKKEKELTLSSKDIDHAKKSVFRSVYKTMLQDAIADGKLTDEEMKQLDAKKDELGLTGEDIKHFASDMYVSGFEKAKEDEKITADEEKELQKLQKYLQVEDDDVPNTKKELWRLRLLTSIQEGVVPHISVSNVILQKGEIPYWSEPSALLEEKVISRRYEGGSHGVSMRVMRGVSYRVGASRGHIVSETGNVVVSRGDLIITSKRIIFRGDLKSFAIALDKLLNIEIFSNGVTVSEVNKAKPRFVNFNTKGNYDIIGAISSYAINHFGNPTSEVVSK